jgi:hypothetical protein
MIKCCDKITVFCDLLDSICSFKFSSALPYLIFAGDVSEPSPTPMAICFVPLFNSCNIPLGTVEFLANIKKRSDYKKDKIKRMKNTNEIKNTALNANLVYFNTNLSFIELKKVEDCKFYAYECC